MKNELKLTADQTTKYDALNSEYNPKMDALAQDASLSMDAQKEKKWLKEKEGKLFELLTPEQQEKYKTMVEQKMKDVKNPSNTVTPVRKKARSAKNKKTGVVDPVFFPYNYFIYFNPYFVIYLL